MLKILEYSHMRDVLAAQRHPRRPDAAFLHPPLVVLQGFTGEQHMKLTAVLFQNMFPAINVTKAKLSECQVRVIACLVVLRSARPATVPLPDT